MSKINKHIVIVGTTHKELSSMSARSREMVSAALKPYFSRVEVVLVEDLKDLERVASMQPDLVFVGLKRLSVESVHGKDVEYVNVPEFFGSRGIKATGSGAEASEIGRDKTKAKDVLLAAGLTTAPYFVVTAGQYKLEDQLPVGFPLFLKPATLGGGRGIDDFSVVRTFREFEAKIKKLEDEGVYSVLAEKYLSGREFTVAILEKEDTSGLTVMPVEQIAVVNDNGDKVIGHEMKYADTEEIVAVEEGRIRQSVTDLASEAFVAIGARGYGRIDIRLGKDDTPYFLEVNLIPSLVEGFGNFPKAYKINTGRSYQEMLLSVARLGLA